MDSETVFEVQSEVTDEALAESASYIGKKLRIEQYTHEATRDTIRRYAWGIGDDNPLWCDPNYAASGPFGTIVAPPTFLYSVFQQGIAPGLAGLQPFYTGVEWMWHRLPRRGEEILAEASLAASAEVKGGKGGRMILQTGHVRYLSGNGDVLAVATPRVLRVPRPDGSGRRMYEVKDQRRYTAEELKQIEADVLHEHRRGEEPRYWEDVSLEDALQPVVKGPIDTIAMTSYYAGSIGSEGYKACELRWSQWRAARETPDLLPNNHDISYLSEFVLPSAGHQVDKVAHAVGMPAAYDNGAMRVGWTAHLVTNWMGDAGFLRSLSARLRGANSLGNTTWISGHVVRKFRDAHGEHAVEVAITGADQDGAVNTEGRAVVWLPVRESAGR